MGIAYDDSVYYGGKPFSFSDIQNMYEGQVMGAWRKHVDNWFMLSFMRTKGNIGEKFQATKELGICEKKLAFWERHPRFNKDLAKETIASKKKEWKVNYGPSMKK